MNNLRNVQLIISACYLIGLLTILIVFGYTPTNDGNGYINYALRCMQQGEPYPCMATIQGEPFIWNIGSINLVIATLSLFGSLYPLLVLMCLLKALTAWILARITAILFDEKTATAVLILYVCYPNNWGQSTTILSEIPMIFLMLLSLWIVLTHTQIIPLAAAGLLLGLANWFRPIAIIFLAALILWFLVFERKQLLRRMLPFTAAFFIFIFAVGIECWSRTGFFVFQSDTLWYNMADETYDGATTDPHYGMPLYPKDTPRYIAHPEQLTCFEMREIWKQRAISWLKDHPLEYLGKIPDRLYYMYQSDIDYIPAFLPDKSNAKNNYVLLPLRHFAESASSLSAAQWMAFATLIDYFAILLLALWGSIMLLRRRNYRSLALPLSIILIGSLSIVLLVQGETRFKVPFMPFIFMLAAVAIRTKRGDDRERTIFYQKLDDKDFKLPFGKSIFHKLNHNSFSLSIKSQIFLPKNAAPSASKWIPSPPKDASGTGTK